MKLTMPAVACLLLLMVSPLAACLWDFDTIKMETQRFPGTLELITGKFLRHSKPFYEWRVEDRQKRIAEAAENDESVAALYDDLAVAQEKTGQSEAAIETMLKKEELWPGQYTTQANLGTFYIHSGQLEKGIEHIEKAIEINPDAHFGREVYQKLLVEYVLENRAQGKLSPPFNDNAYGYEAAGFAKFVLEKREIDPLTEDGSDKVSEEIAKALAGVQGMMHFGNYRSPVLLEALADLLLAGSQEQNARLMACRAYLAASYVSDSPEAQDAFRASAERCIGSQLQTGSDHDSVQLATVEVEFERELKDAHAWFSQLSADEKSWISSSLNPDAEFDRQYRDAAPPETPVSAVLRQDPVRLRDRRVVQLLIFAGMTIAVTGGLIVAGVLARISRRKKAQEPTSHEG
jgi:tetratricopeptide (TPR) repeat protein